MSHPFLRLTNYTLHGFRDAKFFRGEKISGKAEKDIEESYRRMGLQGTRVGVLSARGTAHTPAPLLSVGSRSFYFATVLTGMASVRILIPSWDSSTDLLKDSRAISAL